MALILALALLLIATVSEAAITVNTGQVAEKLEGGAVTSSALAYPGSVTTRQLLIAGGETFDDAVTQSLTSTCSSGSWTVSSFDFTGANLGRAWVAWAIANASGACTVTLALSPSSEASWAIVTASGVDTSTPLDVDGGGQFGTSTSPARSLTTTTANALIIGAMAAEYDLAAVTITPPSSPAVELAEDEGGTFAPYSLVYRLATTATNYTLSWTLSRSMNWGVVVVAFREATAAAGTDPGGLIRHRSSR